MTAYLNRARAKLGSSRGYNSLHQLLAKRHGRAAHDGVSPPIRKSRLSR
jgi:hypothetical protein